MVEAVEGKVQMLADADPTTKAYLYATLGITLTYQHDRRVVTAEARPASHVLTSVSEGGLAGRRDAVRLTHTVSLAA
jgi:hypothetical protein